MTSVNLHEFKNFSGLAMNTLNIVVGKLQSIERHGAIIYGGWHGREASEVKRGMAEVVNLLNQVWREAEKVQEKLDRLPGYRSMDEYMEQGRKLLEEIERGPEEDGG